MVRGLLTSLDKTERFATMNLTLAHKSEQPRSFGFSLIEVLISLVAFGLVVSGLIYGYVQVNRMAEWSSMSLAAQSWASQGLEEVKSAQWDSKMAVIAWGPGTGDEMGFSASQGFTNYTFTSTMDVPTTGAPIPITNYVFVTNISVAPFPQIRMIRSDCVWTFPLDGIVCTNTVVSYRAPDQ